MKLSVRIASIILSGLFLATGVANATGWEEISLEGLVNGSGKLLDRSGNVIKDQGQQALVPSCASELFGPFRFFVQTGVSSKLLILHDGGGACWEAKTCSAPFDVLPPPNGIYDRTVSEFVDEEGDFFFASGTPAGGILDSTSSDNPFKDWTKVFIPYCTGDVGWGNQDTRYAYPSINRPKGQPFFTVHHRGYANIRAVLRWVEDRYSGQTPSKIMIAGTSAGAYAAPLVILPEVKKLFPSVQDTYVIADSGNGIVTDQFISDAKANWGLDRTLPDYLQEVFAQGANGLPVRLYGQLAVRYPTTRFGQFQNAYDGIQTVIYNIMKNIDNPALWNDSGALLASLIEWSASARLAVNLSAWALNYRFYTAAGTEHLVLVNVPPGAGFCSDNFDTESSAGGLLFRDWVNDMVNKPFLGSTGNWRNATCFPNCLQPPQPNCQLSVTP